MAKHPILAVIVGIVGIVGTVFAMSERFISSATFLEFKQHIIYRLDTMDEKLDIILKSNIED